MDFRDRAWNLPALYSVLREQASKVRAALAADSPEALPAALNGLGWADVREQLEMLERAKKTVGDAVKEKEYEKAFEAGPWC